MKKTLLVMIAVALVGTGLLIEAKQSAREKMTGAKTYVQQKKVGVQAAWQSWKKGSKVTQEGERVGRWQRAKEKYKKVQKEPGYRGTWLQKREEAKKQKEAISEKRRGRPMKPPEEAWFGSL